MSEKLILELRFVTGGRAKSLIPGHFLGGGASLSPLARGGDGCSEDQAKQNKGHLHNGGVWQRALISGSSSNVFLSRLEFKDSVCLLELWELKDRICMRVNVDSERAIDRQGFLIYNTVGHILKTDILFFHYQMNSDS